jgi:hypothetical protein
MFQFTKTDDEPGCGDESCMLRKDQLEGLAKGDVLAQNRVINQLSGWPHNERSLTLSSRSNQFLQHYRSACVAPSC